MRILKLFIMDGINISYECFTFFESERENIYTNVADNIQDKSASAIDFSLSVISEVFLTQWTQPPVPLPLPVPWKIISQTP